MSNAVLRDIDTFVFDGEAMVLYYGAYPVGGAPYMRVNSALGEPIATFTTNLPDIPLEPDEFVVAMYNQQELGKWLLSDDYGKFEFTGKCVGTQFDNNAFRIYRFKEPLEAA